MTTCGSSNAKCQVGIPGPSCRTREQRNREGQLAKLRLCPWIHALLDLYRNQHGLRGEPATWPAGEIAEW
ncbi:MAG: hypothetical protein VX768_01670 [Planctomycetota bacterium]|nr:hypothetical protein [Planctomycetota bacterium]